MSAISITIPPTATVRIDFDRRVTRPSLPSPCAGSGSPAAAAQHAEREVLEVRVPAPRLLQGRRYSGHGPQVPLTGHHQTDAAGARRDRLADVCGRESADREPRRARGVTGGHRASSGPYEV